MDALEKANRTYHVAQGSMALLPNYYRWTYGAFLPFIRGKVVELGCGSGHGIGTYADRTDSVLAVDYDPACLADVDRQWPSSRVRTMAADLIGDWDDLDGVTADTVLMMDVVEHFSDDAELVRKAAALLAPGGHLLIKVPAQRELYSPMDQASGHFRRYDRADLVRLADAAGLETIKVSPINRAGALAYRFKNRADSNFSRSFSRSQLQAVNLALPMIRLFDLVPFLPGLSLMGVFRKPAA